MDAADVSLQLATLKDILIELRKRIPHYVLVGVGEMPNRNGDDGEDFHFAMQCMPTMALGLLHRAISCVNHADLIRTMDGEDCAVEDMDDDEDDEGEEDDGLDN